MKKIFTFLSLITVSILLSSHEFWLQPDKFIYNRGETINIKFLVGENFEGENWSGNHSKIHTLDFYFGGVKDDLSGMISDEKGDSAQFTLYDEGTAMVTFNSNNSFIELDSAKFNAYLQEDGLVEAIEYRKQHNETDSSGREWYQRSVKTIFQVGTIFDNTFSRETSLPLDIIPQTNPYKLKSGDSLEIKILFQKNPLGGQLVKLWHKVNGQLIKAEFTTDKNGMIKFPVITNGSWMLSTVKMERLENNPGADWQSYWGSLTWGYE